jgi:hypothetical protein
VVAFIGNSSVSHSGERTSPRTTKWSVPICAADFGRILANLRQWLIILWGGAFTPENASN